MGDAKRRKEQRESLKGTIKEICVPETISVRLGVYDQRTWEEVTKPLPFARWLADEILAAMGGREQSIADVDRGLAIYRQFADAKVGTWIAVQADHHRLMLDQVQRGQWNAFRAMQLRPYFRAIEEARDPPEAEDDGGTGEAAVSGALHPASKDDDRKDAVPHEVSREHEEGYF